MTALARHVFKTSRLSEFCSEKELVNQTGHAVEDWPLVVLKELTDNSLDACEETETAPVVSIAVSQDGIEITDNGPGISSETIAGILDYTARVSSREAYVSPTRGAQGNALKTILAMAFALDGESGETVIESQGVAHRIAFSIDPIRQEPRLVRVCGDSLLETGTRISVSWPNSATSILDDAADRFLQVAEDLTWINPHLTLTVKLHRDGCDPVQWAIPATDPSWRKWRPSDPTSPHWYDAQRLGRLMAAHIAHADDHGRPCPTVREFVSEFRGLSSTAKGRQICDSIGASRLSLAEFYGQAGDRVDALLSEMCKHSAPIKPGMLGAIGKAHLAAKLKDLGAASETFDYRRAEFEHDGLPYLAEAAFGFCPNGPDERRIVTGVNWSAAIGANPFRSLGPGGESLDTILTSQRAGRDEPIVAVLHLACPRIGYLDRGKSSVLIPGSRSW